MGEGLSIARSVANELDAARFDPLLLRSVAHGANSALQNFIERVDKLVCHSRFNLPTKPKFFLCLKVVKDRTASTFVGTLVTPQQLLNAQLATTLYHCWSRLHRIQSEYTESIASLLSGNIQVSHLTSRPSSNIHWFIPEDKGGVPIHCAPYCGRSQKGYKQHNFSCA
jgi:hypothetical protein